MRLRSFAGPIAFVLAFAVLCGGYLTVKAASADQERALVYSAQPPLKGWAYGFYDNGSEQQLTPYAIGALIATAAVEPRLQLGSDWDQRPAYAARYFTMNLLGITDQRSEAWYQTASGSGNAISSGDGTYLGDYTGLHDTDRTSDTASVRLRTAGRKAYLITLTRPWESGPWLVTKVEETEYVLPQ